MDTWRRFHPWTMLVILGQQIVPIVSLLVFSFVPGIIESVFGPDMAPPQETSELADPLHEYLQANEGQHAVYGYLASTNIETTDVLQIVIALTVVPFLLVAYSRRQWRMDDEVIEMREGLFTRKHYTMPRATIQSVKHKTSVFGRMTNTTSLTLSSGDSHDLTLELITLEQATIIRQILNPSHASGIGLHDVAYQTSTLSQDKGYDKDFDANAAKHGALKPTGQTYPLATLSNNDWLLFTGLSLVPSIVWAIALFLIAIALLLGYQLANRETFDALAFIQQSLKYSFIPIVIAAGSTLFHAGMNSVLNYGFKAFRDDHAVFIVKGMLTRVESNIPLKRIQQIIVTSPFVFKAMGKESLRVATADAAINLEETSNISMVSPIQPRNSYPELGAELLAIPIPSLSQLKSSHPNTLINGYVRWLQRSLIVLAGLVVVWWFIPEMWVTLAFLYGIVVMLARPYSMMRRAAFRWYLSEELFIVRRGVLNYETVITPVRAIQSVHITQTRMQHRLGICDVGIDIAGLSAIAVTAQDIALSAAETLSAELLTYAQVYGTEVLDGV